MPIRPGTICLIDYPFTDKAASKLRPALVTDFDNPIFLAVTDGTSAAALHNINFLQIVGHEDLGNYNIVVDPAKSIYKNTGLKVTSTIRCWNINTIHSGLVVRELGSVPENLMKQVKKKLRLRLGL